MPLLSWTDTDRLTDSAYKDKEYIRLSDYTQILDALKAIDDWWNENHNATTGIHSSTYGVLAWTGYDDSGTAPSQTVSHLTQTDLGYIHFEAMGTWPTNRHRAYSGLWRGLTGSGIVEMLPVWIGADLGTALAGSVPVIGTRRLTAGSGAMTIYEYRLPVHSPECVGPAHSDYITAGTSLSSPSDVNVERRTRGRFTSQDTLVHTYKDAVSKSLYRQCWRLAKSLWDAIKYEHSAAAISFRPSPARLYGRASIPVHNPCTSESFSASRQLLIGAHGGVHQYVMPWLRLVKTGTVTQEFGWAMLPAFDDTNAYIDVQPLGQSVNDQLIFQVTAHASMQPATLPSVGALPALDLTANAVQGSSITLAHWKQLHDGLRRYKLLYEVEHNFATGGHRFPFSRMSGATQVYDGAVTAPSAIGNVAYTSTSALGGTNPTSSYTDITQVAIDASPPAGGGIYLPSLVGSAGSGICTVSIAVGPATTYAIIRRKTAGTTNAFNLRVWRIAP